MGNIKPHAGEKLTSPFGLGKCSPVSQGPHYPQLSLTWDLLSEENWAPTKQIWG